MLTVLYESYKPEEVQAKLTEIFDRQYELTLTPKTEIRTRTETEPAIIRFIIRMGQPTGGIHL